MRIVNLITACLSVAATTTVVLAVPAPSPPLVNTHPHRRQPPSAHPFTHTVAQLTDNGTSFENMAFRSNGDLLLTMTRPHPLLYTIKDPWSPDAELSLVHNFSDVTGALLGITETEPDTFVIAAVEFLPGPGSIPKPNTTTLQEVTFSYDNDWPKTRTLASLPTVLLPNGLTKVHHIMNGGDGDNNNNNNNENETSSPPSPSSSPPSYYLLLADSLHGIVFRINPDFLTGPAHQGEPFRILQNSATKVTNRTSPMPLGVNGIRIVEGWGDEPWLYWSDSSQAAVYRVRLDPETILPVFRGGFDDADDVAYPVEKMVEEGVMSTTGIDDFAVVMQQEDGNYEGDSGVVTTLWAATNAGDSVVAVRSVPGAEGERDDQWQQEAILLGGDEDPERTFAGSTSAAFGNTDKDRHVLYVTTSDPAKVVAVDTSGVLWQKWGVSR